MFARRALSRREIDAYDGRVGARELDSKIRRLIEDADLEGAWPLLGRLTSQRASGKSKRALDAFVDSEIEASTHERLAELYAREDSTDHHRRQLAAAFDARLRDRWPTKAMKVVVALASRLPGDRRLRALLIRFDALPVEGLRSTALATGRTSNARTAIFALARAEDDAWLEARVRSGAFGPSALHSLFDAAEDSPRLARRLTHCARELDDPALMKLALEHFEVMREVVQEALPQEDPGVRAALMRHAHRLRDTATVLREGLRHPSPDVRRAALRALIERPVAEAIPDVEPLVDDPDPYDERYNLEPIALLARRFLDKTKR